MNKRVGIITSAPSFINNYGAVLQGFALSKQVSLMGFDCYIVKYTDGKEYVQGAMSFSQRLRGTIFNSKLTLRARSRIVLNKILHRSVYPVFQSFQNDYIRFYKSSYSNFNQLQECAGDFFAFIVGSDQVWNPKVHHGVNDPGYFLQFTPAGVKRIAYAPSMGVNEIPDACKETLPGYLSSFDAVSVREKSGANIIRDVCGYEPQVVLDPTLILDRKYYDEIKRVPTGTKEKYLVYYKFGSMKSVEKRVAEIAKRYNLKIVCIPSGLDTAFRPDYSIGPREFIGLISEAELICTDSFHATVFSIIYNRPFISFSREDETKEKVTMNSRIVNLLEQLHLESRYVGNGSKLDFDCLFTIDYTEANQRLQKKRSEALNFLYNALDKDRK